MFLATLRSKALDQMYVSCSEFTSINHAVTFLSSFSYATEPLIPELAGCGGITLRIRKRNHYVS